MTYPLLPKAEPIELQAQRLNVELREGMTADELRKLGFSVPEFLPPNTVIRPYDNDPEIEGTYTSWSWQFELGKFLNYYLYLTGRDFSDDGVEQVLQYLYLRRQKVCEYFFGKREDGFYERILSRLGVPRA